MALFAISYDLIKRKDYQPLWDELERLGAFKPMRSFYLADLNNTASEVRNHLRGFIDDDDKLMVVEFVGEPAFTKANKGTNDWIAAHC